MNSLNLFVLGAGASYVHGAPLTDGILPYALRDLGETTYPRLAPIREFLRDVFHFDADTHCTNDEYPGLVNVLSTVDMALDRKENLSSHYNRGRLREVRHAIEYAILKVLDDALSSRAPSRRRSTATRDLIEKIRGRNPAIISFNYDVVVNIALHGNLESDDYGVDGLPETQSDVIVNYGVEFANVDHSMLPENCIPLLKLHGSFNWFFSSTSGNLYFGGFRKSVGRLLDEERSRWVENITDAYCERRADLEPILITPTHLKDLRNIHLGILWRKAEETIRRAKSITFIGYSLPGDDLHIKYLFKRGIETSNTDPPKINVVDYAAQEGPTDVEQNYKSFFGAHVNYYRGGFDRYVQEQLEDDLSQQPPAEPGA